MKLSRNFSLSEFESKDGAETPRWVHFNLIELAQNLEVIRKELGDRPITINSGYRSPEHNKAVGGSNNSYHLRGLAADIVVQGLTPNDVHTAILNLMEAEQIKKGGLSEYATFVHYDIRGYYASW